MRAVLCGTVVAAVAGFGLAGIKNTHTPVIEERATTTGEAGSEAESTAATVAAIAEAGLLDASQTLPPEAQPEQIGAVSTPDRVYAEQKEAVSSAETLNESLSESSQTLPPETQPVQIATVSTPIRTLSVNTTTCFPIRRTTMSHREAIPRCSSPSDFMIAR